MSYVYMPKLSAKFIAFLLPFCQGIYYPNLSHSSDKFVKATGTKSKNGARSIYRKLFALLEENILNSLHKTRPQQPS